MQQALSLCDPPISLIRTPPALKEIANDFANRLLAHPFLVSCSNGTITRKELDNLLIQQGKYSQYFTRYLCALISQLEENTDVLRLAENLSEELGYGDDSRIPHSRIYAEMVRDLGLNGAEEPILPETQVLIDSMFMLCRQPGGVAGLAALCLGAEAVVPSLY
ncbi:MAG: iron-containing redox enzyme family protein [Burkholderiales bacterium]